MVYSNDDISGVSVCAELPYTISLQYAMPMHYNIFPSSSDASVLDTRARPGSLLRCLGRVAHTVEQAGTARRP